MDTMKRAIFSLTAGMSTAAALTLVIAACLMVLRAAAFLLHGWFGAFLLLFLVATICWAIWDWWRCREVPRDGA